MTNPTHLRVTALVAALCLSACAMEDASELSSASFAVKGHVIINDALDALLAEDLTVVHGNLIIEASGFEEYEMASLTQIDGDLIVRNSDELVVLSLPSLAVLGGDILIQDNASLDWIGSSIASVDGGVEFSGNGPDASLYGLQYLHEVGGDVRISGNDGITNANSMHQLQRVYGDLSIAGNPSLASLSGWWNLEEVHGGLHVGRNDNLDSLSSLSSLALVAGGVKLAYTAISSLDLNPGVELHGDLWIVGNYVLADVDGLSGMTVAGDVWLQHNPVLTDLSGLSSLVHVTGQFAVVQMEGLYDLSGLSSLQTIGGDLFLTRNDGLTYLTGLTGVTSSGSITISSNPALRNLSGLSSVTVVNGPLWLTENHSLNNVSGLSNVTHVGGPPFGGGVTIGGNSSLATCAAEQLVEDIGLANIDLSSDGTWRVRIEGNRDDLACPPTLSRPRSGAFGSIKLGF